MTDVSCQRLEELTEWRRELHRHPELAFQEHRTSAFVAKKLQEFGLEVSTGIGRTGVVGALRSKRETDRAILLRADMDALPIQELSQCAHRSQCDGVMHACGHDGHTAMLLGAARELAREAHAGTELGGTVYFVFQPAEEGAGGARAMLDDGLLTRFPVEAAFGLHNWPGLEAGHFAVRPGPMMAASDTFEIVIEGRGCHAAMPALGIDPILIGSQLVTALQSIVSRGLSADQPAVLSVTQFHAGDALGVIPQSAVLRGTCRTFHAETRDSIQASLERLTRSLCAGWGAQVRVHYRRGYPPTVNAAPEAAFCARVARELWGDPRVHDDLPPSMGAEDFAFFLQQVPGAYAWLGNGPTGGDCMLHNPHYDFNDAVLGAGVQYWMRLAEAWFKNPASTARSPNALLSRR